MTKFKKRLLAIILVMTFCTTFFAQIVNAETYPSNVSHENSIRNALDTSHVNYSLVGEDVVETVTFDQTSSYFVRVISPNGDAVMTTYTSDGAETSYFTGYDYEMFYNCYYIQNHPPITPLNNDITGSQFIHRFIGRRTQTFTKEDIENVSDAADLAAKIAKHFSLPAYLLIKICDWFFSRDANPNNFDKLVIEVDLYEVLFAYDYTYFIHCYHEVGKWYNTGNPNPVDTYVDYYQVIGG